MPGQVNYASSKAALIGFTKSLALEIGSRNITVNAIAPGYIQTSMTDLSDVAQTLAVVAPFASSPTRIDGIGFVRGKETDRIGATVAELRRCGIEADELPDGMTIRPSRAAGATIDPHGDHRMAMSFAVLGLAIPGIVIAEPQVVAKTFPAFFELIDQLHRLPARSDR